MLQVASLAVPEPELTPADLVARAQGFRERLRAGQDEADARGHYDEGLHRDFARAGFYRITQPRRFGGYEFDLRTFYQVMLEVSRGHPAVGWGLTLAASHAFVVASLWPAEAQAELFGDGHFVCAHRPPGMGRLTPVEGGYSLSGTWDYCSGITWATHFIGGAMLERDGRPVVAQAIVARPQFEIVDDWGGDRVFGMRASGSNGVRVADAFVPAHHVVALSPGLNAVPSTMTDGTAGTALHGNPLYLGRLSGPFHLSLIVPIVGAARAALDEYEAIITRRTTMSMPAMPRFEHFDFQRPFGQALMLTDAAEALLIRGADMYAELCRRWQSDGSLIGTEENMRLWGLLMQAGQMASQAVELLFRTAGTQAMRNGSRLQRYYSDVAMYRSHSSAQDVNFASGLARLHFGLPWGMYGL